MGKKVQMTLVGVSSNAFGITGAFRKNASRQGWTKEEIAVVIDEAQSDDYNHLLWTIQDNIDDTGGDDENDDEYDRGDGYDADDVLSC